MTLSSASFTLLEQLIQHLLGDDIDHATLTRLAQKSAASLEKFKAMSTDEHHIEKRWQSLCEKFMIKGYDDLADKLVKDKIMFLEPRRELISDIAAAQQRILKYDMLSLLLALSRNPTQKQKHLLTSTILSNDVSQANFWKEVLVEEPMEGDHWMEWENLSEGSQETADEFELDHERLSRYQRRKPQELHDTAEDMMWDEKSTVMQRIHLEDRDIKDLSNRQYWETKTDITEKIISDADLMREILFLLQGHPGMIFKRNEEDDNFKLVMNYNRPEQPSFLSIKSCLEEFCFHGNTLLSLRLWVARCLESDVKVYGQTSQAFAVSVATFLRSLDKYMADIQVNFCRAGDTRIVSLLHLKSALRPFLDRVDATHDVLIDALGDDVHRPRDIAMRILRSLTASIENHQSSGRMDICQHLMRIYKDTMVPLGRMIDDWVMYGSLAGDVADEFFISRSEDIPDHSPDFWSDGFKLHSDESISVIFDTHFLQQAFAAGKSIHIISHFEHYTHSTNKPSLTFLQNLSCHVNFPSNPDEISTPRASTTMQDDDDTDDKTDLLHQILFPLGRRCSLDRQRTHHTSSSTTHQPPMEIFLFGRDVAECERTYISKPYQQSSLKLNKVLEEKCGLSRHLRALASVYLMLHDHTMHTFCELLFQRMDKHRFPVDAIQLNKLFKEANALSGRTPDFDAAASVGITDMVFDDGDADYLGRITLHYELPWPVNNFIKQSSLAEYSKVTTLLLRLKRAKHILERHMLFESQHDMRLYSLRMKLVWFMNAFWGYVMTTVLHAETNLLESAVRETHDIDRISALHASYVSKIVDRCLLGEKTRSIQKAILDILKIVHDLARLFSGERKLSPDVQVLEKEFNRSNEFIGTTLKIIARKGGFPWFDALASSLSAQ